jgi:hypothetical protein
LRGKSEKLEGHRNTEYQEFHQTAPPLVEQPFDPIRIQAALQLHITLCLCFWTLPTLTASPRLPMNLDFTPKRVLRIDSMTPSLENGYRQVRLEVADNAALLEVRQWCT